AVGAIRNWFLYLLKYPATGRTTIRRHGPIAHPCRNRSRICAASSRRNLKTASFASRCRADPLVRGRPPGRPLRSTGQPDRGVRRGPGGPPHQSRYNQSGARAMEELKKKLAEEVA